jgi:hypothetical protein
MEPIFSLRDLIHVMLSLKLMKDSEILVWDTLVDQMSDAHLSELYALFLREHEGLSSALRSLEEYVEYVHATAVNRQQWLAKIQHEDRGLRHAIDGILQSKRHWTGAQVDSAFQSDDAAIPFIAGLAIRDLQELKSEVDIHDQAGEYDDDEGEPTESRDTLTGILAALEEHAWNRERDEAEHLAANMPSLDSVSADPGEAARCLFTLGRDLHKAHVDLRSSKAAKAQEIIRAWVDDPPSWFKISWDMAKVHLASAALTVNVNATIAGLGAVSSHLLQNHLAAAITAIAARVPRLS